MPLLPFIVPGTDLTGSKHKNNHWMDTVFFFFLFASVCQCNYDLEGAEGIFHRPPEQCWWKRSPNLYLGSWLGSLSPPHLLDTFSHLFLGSFPSWSHSLKHSSSFPWGTLQTLEDINKNIDTSCPYFVLPCVSQNVADVYVFLSTSHFGT